MTVDVFEIALILVLPAALAVVFFITAGAIAILFFRVPFAPTPQRNVERIMGLFNLQPGETFFDLGCGDGRFIIEAQKRQAQATGFEISPWAFLRCRLNLLLNRSQAQVRYKNFYTVDLRTADAVFCFLMTSVMPRVEQKLKNELKAGSRIICYGFPLPQWPPEKIIELKPGNPKASKIYCYRKT
ncbi:MAG: hypothetical protein A2840_01505 [Candidatus Buchananbacteria bacterium RIFCSPHIGHO2_01_FULL_47_11b]|uniref:Methyltransferase domain-containing protein n=1 Tax=Candidatus Buchananbacteria bacterium RIFCSPHIGHO2_01_FULL_47_11b TaxID=1797537 RepID=A0A1G1Y3X6_9BACT|nr:MAG: hypothetical protein A2840_01505 [Candidatus Buchananbacteria bacterium RIFCSPHIGHO2_01_FULL_47_11b]